MPQEDKNPLFSERFREQLLLQRILVLDGVLDDDNGTLPATLLLTLAAEDPAAGVALWINSPGGSVASLTPRLSAAAGSAGRAGAAGLARTPSRYRCITAVR